MYECMAVSRTNNPVAGGWYFYPWQVETGGTIPDYPKLGVWPDGIYMSANLFSTTGSGSFKNVQVWAFNRREMEAEARALLGDPPGRTLERSADLRFLGQAHQLTVALPPGWDAAAMIRAFEEAYARVYGRIPPGVGIQALQWRLTARGPAPSAETPART